MTMALTLTVAPHPLLDATAFVSEFPQPIGGMPPAEWLSAQLALTSPAPMSADDAVRATVRDLLRHGGFKPTGRSKPASEYLLRAAGEGTLSAINPAVDACNVVSLHSGLPISVVDLERAAAPYSVSIAPAGTSYVFNASGQVIDVGGLLCLNDAAGPCANAVKDAQRTKTHAGTTRTLSVVWGAVALPGRAARATTWYRELIEKLGARTEDVALVRAGR